MKVDLLPDISYQLYLTYRIILLGEKKEKLIFSRWEICQIFSIKNLVKKAVFWGIIFWFQRWCGRPIFLQFYRKFSADFSDANNLLPHPITF